MSRDAGVGRPISRWLTPAVRAVVWFLGALTLLALLDRFSAYLELLTFFRVQYAALLLVAGVIALAVRLPRVALAAVALAAVNLAVVAPTWFSPPGAESATGSGSLTLLVLNLEDGNPRHADVARLIGETNPDVVGLLELTPVWAGGLAPALDRFPQRRLSPEERRLRDRALQQARLSSGDPRALSAEMVRSASWRASIWAETRSPSSSPTCTPPSQATSIDASSRRSQTRGTASVERLAICGDLNSVPWSSSFRHLASAGDLTDSHRGHWLEGSWPTLGHALTRSDRQLPDQRRRHRPRASVRRGRWLRSLPVAHPLRAPLRRPRRANRVAVY